jgi:hypothetical protein
MYAAVARWKSSDSAKYLMRMLELGVVNPVIAAIIVPVAG